MIRNFENEAASVANIAGVRPLPEDLPPSVQLDERLDEIPRRDESASLSPFHTNEEEIDESANSNTAKIAGAVVVGLLIIGGGIYAYQSSSATSKPTQVAMKEPAPARTPVTPPAPQPVTPDTSASAPAAPVPASSNSEAAPKPGTTEASLPTRMKPASDPALDAPMTLTPETAPPPQGASASQTAAVQPAQTQSSAQAAMQPITPPLVSAPAQPATAMANNNAQGVTLPSGPPDVQPPDIQPAPAQ